MSFSREQMPDFNKATGTSEDMIGNILASYHPSAAISDQTSELQNKMRNQDFDTGLSGSSLEAQNLGEGEAKAVDQGQEQYVHDVMGVEPQVIGAQTAVNRANAEMPYQFAGDVIGLGGDIAAPFTGGTSALVGNDMSSLLQGGGGAMPMGATVSGLSGSPTSAMSNPLSALLKNPEALMHILRMAGGR